MTTFVDQTPDIATPRPELETEATAADLASLELEVATDGLDLVAATAPDRPAAVIAADRPAPATPASAASSDDDEPAEPVATDDLLDIEDSTRLYLREIARVPLLTAEEEVMLAKTMELGRRIEERSRDRRPGPPCLGGQRHRAEGPDHPSLATPIEFVDESERIVRAALASDDAMDLLVTAPRFGLTDEIAAATGEAGELLERARILRAVYNERLDAERSSRSSTSSTGRPAPAGRARERGADRDADVDPRRGRPARDPALDRGRQRPRRGRGDGAGPRGRRH